MGCDVPHRWGSLLGGYLLELRDPDSQWNSGVMTRVWERGAPAGQRMGYTRPCVGSLLDSMVWEWRVVPECPCQAGGFRVDGCSWRGAPSGKGWGGSFSS